MSKIFIEDTEIQDIADAIREKNGTNNTYKPSEMPQAIKDIQSGDSDSYYDAFWDAFQQNGERTNYSYAFAYGWDNETFNPKYDMKPKNMSNMFYNSGIAGDLTEMLTNFGITLDTSSCIEFGSMFQGSGITRIPHFNCGKTSVLQATFTNNTNLVTIDKLTVHKDLKYSVTFSGCLALENITIEGEIGSAISFAHSSKLTTASVNSIIDALVDLTGQAAQTLTLHATVKGKLTQDQIAQITNKNWTLA